MIMVLGFEIGKCIWCLVVISNLEFRRRFGGAMEVRFGEDDRGHGQRFDGEDEDG